jgi:type IV secretory pathway VirB4 component
MIQIDESSTKLSQELEKLKTLVTENIEKIAKIGDLLEMAKKEKLSNICSSLNKWVNLDEYGFIFNSSNSLDLFSSDVTGINLNAIVNNEELKTAIFDYIVYSIVEKSDGSPSILAIDEGWLLFDNPYFSPRISTLLKSLYSKNIAVIMTTSGADSYETSNIKLSVKNVFPTQILLPNIKATIYQRKIFGITEEESRVLSVMREENGTFLLKHSGNIVVSSLDFSFLTKDEIHILSSNNLYFNVMAKAKELADSDKPEEWLPIMFRLIKEYEKVKLEEKLKEREKRQIQWEEAKQKKNEKPE